MSAQDALWLTMDRPNNLMVVDVATVLGGVPTLAQVTEGFADLVHRHPVFGRRAERSGVWWTWVDDPAFEVSQHVTEVALPPDAGMAEVQEYMARVRSVPLDRDRPLWSAALLSPVRLSDGTDGSVVVTRFHHAIADGVRLTQVLLSVLAPTSASGVPRVARAGTTGGSVLSFDAMAGAVQEGARVVQRSSRSALGALGRVVADPIGTVQAFPSAARWGAGWVRHPDRFIDALGSLGVDDHRTVNDATSVGKLVLGGSSRTVWSGRPGTRKAVAWCDPFPLPWVRDAARRHEATVNDVLVGALAGALRAYLAGRGDAVDEVVWMVPVNLKPFDEELPEDLGNHFALVMLDIPLTGTDPDQRIADVRARMLRIKNSDEPVLTFGLQRAISVSPTRLATFATDFFANKAVGVLTNVPGPREELGLAGIPVRQVIGFAPCSGDQPLTATIFTYHDTVTVGFASDADLVPDPQTLVALVEREISLMRAAD